MGKTSNLIFSIVMVVIVVLSISLFYINNNKISDLQKDIASLNSQVQSNSQETQNRLSALDESISSKASVEEVIENIENCITETDRTDETSGGRKNTEKNCKEVCEEKELTCTSALFIEIPTEGTGGSTVPRKISCTDKHWIGTYSAGAELDCTCC
jgi:cell shape-determining protein MreC|tara:strand:+ start:216 stop:683 length:468 start_codon:yes stop_codon:yes gene_type:complete